MQPVSVGHAILLQRLGSLFASPVQKDHDKACRGDLAEAMIVLSRPWVRAAALVQTRLVVPLMWWWGWRLRSAATHIRTTEALSSYICDAWRGPRVWLKASPNTQTHGEALGLVVSVLKGSMGQSNAEALATPLRQALWDVCLYLQGQGVLEIVDSGDDTLIDAAERMRKELNGAQS